MSHYTHLIWDFNGTLYNDLDACLKSANQLLSAHGLPQLSSLEQYRAAFGFPIIDYYRRLGFDFERLSYADLAVEWVAYYLENSRTSKLYPETGSTLAAVRDRGLSQLILSATELQMLSRQVQALGIEAYFDRILGLENIRAYSKEEIGLAWRREHPQARVLFVGDTDHDAAVAKAIGADCILLSGGHQLPETLAACRPLAVVSSLREVLKFL